MTILSEYRTMWVVVLFDLPTVSKSEKTAYRKFHTFLLEDGFTRVQYSVYGRHCASRELAEVHTGRVRGNLPPGGEVRMLQMTDAQFARIETFRAKNVAATERDPEQLTFL